MVGRCGFIGDILYSIGVTGFIYPIIGHWSWGPDGWLAVMAVPFRDFAGSTVVHTIGGVISLAGSPWDRGSAVSSLAMVAGQCCRTTLFSAPWAA
jgi:ammonia channel protein AmtB